MMKNMAHILDGKVVNVSKWDGLSVWSEADNTVEIPVVEYFDEYLNETRQRLTAGIGWDYIDGEFVDNRPVYDSDEWVAEGNEPTQLEQP